MNQLKKELNGLLDDGEWTAFLGFLALIGSATAAVGTFLMFVLMPQQ